MFDKIGVNRIYDYHARISLYNACCATLGVNCSKIEQLCSSQKVETYKMSDIVAFLYELWLMCQVYLATNSTSVTGAWELHSRGNKVVDSLKHNSTTIADLLWDITAYIGYLKALVGVQAPSFINRLTKDYGLNQHEANMYIQICQNFRCPDSPDIVVTRPLSSKQRRLISPNAKPGYQVWQILDKILLIIEAKLGCSCTFERNIEERCDWTINQALGYSLLFGRKGARVIIASLTDFCCKDNLKQMIDEIKSKYEIKVDIKLIDNLRPGNSKAINEFHESIRELFYRG